MEIKIIEWFDDRFYKIEYEKDGKVIIDFIPSVTTKLAAVAKPFLAKWRGDIGNREADLRVLEGQDRGTKVHYAWQMLTTPGGVVVFQNPRRPAYTQAELLEIAEKHDHNIAILTTQDEMYQVTKLNRWLDVVKPKSIISEKIVYDLDNRDAGTADNIMELEGGSYEINGRIMLRLPAGFYVIDLKTGKSVGDDAKMQTATYFKCAKKMGLCDPIGVLILHTSANTKGGIEGLSTIYLNKETIEKEYIDYRKVSDLWISKFSSIKPILREIPTLITRNESS